MRKHRLRFLYVVLTITLLFILSYAWSAESTDAKQITCAGTIVTEQDQPIAGVKVTMYEMVYDDMTYTYDPKRFGEVLTGTDGAFSFKETIEANQYPYGYIVADKEGLALGFDTWNMRDGSKELEIKLGPSRELTGIVVDETGKPVADASVLISTLVLGEGRERKYLTGATDPKLVTTNTDATGKFAFTRIPAGATAEFIISKPGRATVSTYKRQPGVAYQKLNFTEGQKDVKLILPAEAKIEGIVVEKNTDKPVSGVQIRCTSGQEAGFFRLKPLISKEDGTFHLDALEATRYLLEIVQTKEELPDWVADPVEVITEASKTQSDIKIELSKGGVLEVKVTDAVNKEPVKEATVGLNNQATGRYAYSRSDDNGMAWMRLMPGDYQVTYVYKQDYSRQRLQDIVSIVEGQTEHLEYELVGMPKITGVVRDEAGKPLEGAALQVCPTGREPIPSNAGGKFEVIFDPGSWPSSRTPTMILVGRHVEQNLAGAIQIDEDTRQIDIELRPAVTLFGKVVDQDDKRITNAQVRVMIHGPTWGSTLREREPVRTSEEGGFEIKAIPAGHKYSFYVQAEGYGENRREEFDTTDIEGNRLDVGKLTLAIANLSVSGIVVDANDQPVAGASIYCSGDGQSNSQTQTDAEGKFTLENICAGKVRISANKRGSTRLYGSIETDGGATDVKIVISQRSTTSRYEPRRPPSLVGRPLPDFKNLNVKLPEGSLKGKIILVCFWDMEQRPSRHCLTQLTRQAATLKDKDVVVVAVQASKVDRKALDDYVKKYNVPFPVGMIQSNFEKARFSWGIRSLPWLILTDTNHVVRSAGFAFKELNEKLGEIDGG
jgi:protocatechuate 3,4-dioxygenase beta subunit